MFSIHFLFCALLSKAKHAIFSFNVYWVLICIRFEHTFLKVQIARYSIAVRHLLKADILTYIPKIGTASSYNYKCHPSHPWWRFLFLSTTEKLFYKWIKHRHNKDYYLSVFPTLPFWNFTLFDTFVAKFWCRNAKNSWFDHENPKVGNIPPDTAATSILRKSSEQFC